MSCTISFFSMHQINVKQLIENNPLSLCRLVRRVCSLKSWRMLWRGMSKCLAGIHHTAFTALFLKKTNKKTKKLCKYTCLCCLSLSYSVYTQIRMNVFCYSKKVIIAGFHSFHNRKAWGTVGWLRLRSLYWSCIHAYTRNLSSAFNPSRLAPVDTHMHRVTHS